MINKLDKKSFLHTRQCGSKVVSKNFIFIYNKNNLNYNRFGFIASKSSFKRAVDRNFVKRRVKFSSRPFEGRCVDGWFFDIVIIARKFALNSRFFYLQKDIENLFKNSLQEVT